MSFQVLFFYFVIYAFLGWISEVIFAYYKHHKFVNRGFLHGPFCPIYGVGAVSIYVIAYNLEKINVGSGSLNLFMEFIYVTIIATVLEYLTGFILEKFFHTKWWDYSNNKFNIKGYVCLTFSILWGLAGVLVLNTVQVAISDFVSDIPKTLANFFEIVLLVYFTADITLTVKELVDYRKILLEVEARSKHLHDRFEEEVSKGKENLELRFAQFEENTKHRRKELEERRRAYIEGSRFNDAFPNMRTRARKLDLEKLKERISKGIHMNRDDK